VNPCVLSCIASYDVASSVCRGHSIRNHEQDVAHKDMVKRIGESKFMWINTNAPSMPLPGGAWQMLPAASSNSAWTLAS